MKVVILAGGLGTRLSEETVNKPKPMVEIGNEPILWHIMKTYSNFGFNEFVVCLGYKGYMIKEYFANYYLHKSDITFDLQSNTLVNHGSTTEPWKVSLIDTGLNTMTGGRIKRIQDFIGDETFMMTYGDGLANINLPELVAYHKSKKQIATLTAVRPTGRFGALTIDCKTNITSFEEKPEGDGSWVNGGFFVLEPQVFKYIDDDTTIFERTPLESLAQQGELNAFYHNGFWMAMDKLSDKIMLEKMWLAGEAKWKTWRD